MTVEQFIEQAVIKLKSYPWECEDETIKETIAKIVNETLNKLKEIK